MKFNYAFRKREFDREWDRIEKLCLAEGISAEAIAEARKETWEEVKSDRRFARHTADGVDYDAIITDPSSDLSAGSSHIAVAYDYFDCHERYFWIDNPENPILWGLARQLDNSEKELLTLRFKEGFTNEEIGQRIGLAESTVRYRLRKILLLVPGADSLICHL